MGQADKINSQLFGPGEQSQGILTAVGAASAERRLFMYANTAEKNRPAIQQDLRPPGFNRAEPNLFLHLVRLRFDRHLVELGTVRRPQRQIGIESNLRRSIRIGSKGLAN